MIEKITDQNLERYDSRLKEWCDKKFFEKGNYGKYQTTEEAGAVAFYPVPNTPLEGKVKFNFKETMPANGDKSPDNPSTITGVNSVEVTRCGKNLCPSKDTTEAIFGVEFTPQSDGGYKLYGTTDNTNTVRYYLTNSANFLVLKAGQTYTISLGSASQNTNILFQGFNAQNQYIFSTHAGGSTTVTVSNNKDEYLYCPIVVIKTTGAVDTTLYPQIEFSSTVTTFEPYSGADYTINLGNTYYGGSLDVSTGLMTVTWTGYDIGESMTNYSVSNAVFYFDSPIADIATSPTCESFVFNQVPLSSLVNGEFRYQLGLDIPQGNIRWLFKATDYSDVESFSTAFTGKKLIYKLATSYTVQLNPTQIYSLLQTDKYTPRLNIVYTDADSIQISYLKSPIRDEYEKTQAILSLGGNS